MVLSSSFYNPGSGSDSIGYISIFTAGVFGAFFRGWNYSSARTAFRVARASVRTRRADAPHWTGTGRLQLDARRRFRRISVTVLRAKVGSRHGTAALTARCDRSRVLTALLCGAPLSGPSSAAAPASTALEISSSAGQ